MLKGVCKAAGEIWVHVMGRQAKTERDRVRLRHSDISCPPRAPKHTLCRHAFLRGMAGRSIYIDAG